MILDKIKKSVQTSAVSWQKHALQRMFERGISRFEVKEALNNGVVIEDYTDDYPFPSVLIAFISKHKPLHVVVSYDEAHEKCYIITAYIPDSEHFGENLISRRIK